MKLLAWFVTITIMTSCNHPTESERLQTKVDSLQNCLNNSYKPDIGNFMTDIQIHHAKLWFAGTNNNWELANFEIGEIEEATNNIRKFNKNLPEARSISLIDPAIDSVKNAIKQRNALAFTKSYALLTKTCNSCHKITSHGFNVITIPSGRPGDN